MQYGYGLFRNNIMDLRSFDISLLVSLEALLRLRHVTRAADELAISQPALSRRLKSLREAFGDPLLVAAEGGRGMTLTARGEALQTPLHLALEELSRAIAPQTPFVPATAERTFHIMASDYAALTFGLPLIAHLETVAPNIRISIANYDRDLLLPQMEEGRIDLLIGSLGMTPETLRARKLSDERFILAQRKDHPRGTEPTTLDEFCDLTFVLMVLTAGTFTGGVDETLAAQNRARNVMISVQQFTLIPPLLMDTDYVCVLPERMALRYTDKLHLTELPFETRGFSLYTAWHARVHADKGHRWLRRELADLASPGAN
ncbi:MAG: LysR family transcriptional regulator [Pseudomonadota bacterium]